ncbi:MAG: copper amine oxidase N-terminal domain-containing protein [Clostridia bacterium]|nr:copper amine oxidase N-terminal domain-containing protein [Clostridia bacterium]
MKKITAIILSMLMVIGMVGNVCAAYEVGGIATVVGSAITLAVDVEADAMAKAAGASKYVTEGAVDATYLSRGREFDFRAVIDLANVEAKYEAGKALAEKAFNAKLEDADVADYMAAFDELSVTGSFVITVNYDEGLTLPEMTADMLDADETLFTWGAPVDNGEGTVTLTVNVADGVKAKDIEEKLFDGKFTLTCEGVSVAEEGTYNVSGSMTGTTVIKEGEATIATITYTSIQDDVDAEGNLTATVNVKKRTGSVSSSDAPTTGGSTGSTTTKEPEATVKDDVVTVPKDYKEDKVTVSYKAPENVVADTIVVVDANGEVIEVEYDAEKGTITFPAGEAGEYTIEAATEEEVMILTIDEHDAHVFGDEKTNDVAPKIVNDRTMLPARFVAEHLGASVAWDEAARKVTITKDDIVIEITIDAETAVVNGKEVKLDAPAFIENDRTYTPIRFISENLGAKVFWNGETEKVTIVK